MNNRIVYLLFCVMILYSCTSNKYETKDITGQWKFIKHESNQPQLDESDPEYIPDSGFEDYFVPGFHFINEKDVSYKIGFYRTNGKGRKDYLGTRTTYRIISDSLKMYHKADGKWNAYKILSLTKDTLKLVAGNGYDMYAKLTYKTDAMEHYDKIIMSSSGCYGSCPILSISIDNAGAMLFLGH